MPVFVLLKNVQLDCKSPTVFLRYFNKTRLRSDVLQKSFTRTGKSADLISDDLWPLIAEASNPDDLRGLGGRFFVCTECH